ncbi:MAG: hypothetical protein HQ481_00545 [Alphaproteobacteria bacterium]|nr:hypothetical protein [Alphaproteobacteria bacterium]
MTDLPAGVVAADTVTRPTDMWHGAVLIAASHGGVYAAYCAVKAGVRGVILNDAGRGKDDAGIGGGAYCAALGIPYAAVDTRSARIGNGDSMASEGIISFANPVAEAAGVRSGMASVEAAQRMLAAPLSDKPVPHYDEARTELAPGPSGRRIILMDSISLAGDQDIGQVIISGSHGGILGLEKKAALKIDGYAAFFNDAGESKDGAGWTRLPALDEREIAAGTVAAMSARIGDGRSTYEDGVLSRVNETAIRLGGVIGMRLKDFANSLIV